MQRRVVETVLERLQSSEAEDLPAVARFLLQFAAPGACLNSVSKCHGLGPTGTCQLLHCSCRQSIRALLLASHLPCHCMPALQLHSGTTCLLLRPFPQVVTSLRQSLHFVCASDPRIAVSGAPAVNAMCGRLAQLVRARRVPCLSRRLVPLVACLVEASMPTARYPWP